MLWATCTAQCRGLMIDAVRVIEHVRAVRPPCFLPAFVIHAQTSHSPLHTHARGLH